MMEVVEPVIAFLREETKPELKMKLLDQCSVETFKFFIACQNFLLLK